MDFKSRTDLLTGSTLNGKAIETEEGAAIKVNTALSSYDTRSQVDTKLSTKSNTSHTHALPTLSDVTVASPVTGHTLRYNGSMWVNTYPLLSDNNDVVPSGLVANHYLRYDGTKWVNTALPTATTGIAGIVQLSTSTSSTSSALAATASAVKSAYDLANAALPQSGGTVTGATTFNSTVTVANKVNINKFSMEYNASDDSVDFIFN